MGSPWGWIGTGLVVSLTGAVVLALGRDDGPAAAAYVGLVVAGLGGLATMLGVIGAGVVLGLEHYDKLNGRDPLA